MKFLLCTIWLLLPIGALLLLAADFKRFEASAQAEQLACSDLEQHVRRYGAAFAASLSQLKAVRSLEGRDHWRRNWQRVQKEEQAESMRLPKQQFSRYPRTQAVLNEARQKLAELKSEVDSAFRARESAIKTQAAMDDMRAQVYELYLIGEQYRHPLTYGIYLQLQERLGEAEERLKSHERVLSRIEDEELVAALNASAVGLEINGMLADTEQARSADGRVTYREALLARFNQFSLRHELTQLFASQ